MGISFWHLIILAVLALMLFGKGRVSDLMGDVAKGIKSFRRGLADDDDDKKITDEQEKLRRAVDVTPVDKTPADKTTTDK